MRQVRFVPKDPTTQVAFGWCFSQPKSPPPTCSWCGVDFVVVNGVLLCRICDTPRRTGELRPVDLDATDE